MGTGSIPFDAEAQVMARGTLAGSQVVPGCTERLNITYPP